MEENKKDLTVDDVMQQFNEYKEKTTNELNEVKKQLEQEKLKNAQYSIVGVTKKVETSVKAKEPVEFDFDF